RKTDAASFEFIRRVQALKGSEEFAGVIHVETYAVVANKIDVFRRAALVSDFDRRRAVFASELDCIRKKILEDLRDQSLVSVRIGKRMDLQSDFSVLTAGIQLLFESRTCRFAHIDLRKDELLAAKTRQCKQAVNQLAHFFGVRANDFEQTASLVVE